jgi:LEA14-like dessication related protein
MQKYVFFLLVLSLLLSCKSPPHQSPEQVSINPSPENPSAVLEFERIEADSINHVMLHYRLKTANPRSQPVELEIKNWKGLINEVELTGDSSVLTLDGGAAWETRFITEPFSSAENNLVLYLDLNNLHDASVFPVDDEYLEKLILDLDYSYENSLPLKDEVSVNAVFPRIRKPDFTITSISIMQAELVNTSFKVNLRIDNPNIFPVALSSFGYELYGDGSFWADGREKDVLFIPAQSSSETSLCLTMNFINMKRKLLDDIIAMRQVRYRFSGNVDVATGVAWLPGFRMDFDRSGNSPVIK